METLERVAVLIIISFGLLGFLPGFFGYICGAIGFMLFLVWLSQ